MVLSKLHDDTNVWSVVLDRRYSHQRLSICLIRVLRLPVRQNNTRVGVRQLSIKKIKCVATLSFDTVKEPLRFVVLRPTYFLIRIPWTLIVHIDVA